MFSRSQIALRYTLYVLCASLPILKSAVESSNPNWAATLVSMLLASAVVLRAYCDQSTAKIEPGAAPATPRAADATAKTHVQKPRLSAIDASVAG